MAIAITAEVRQLERKIHARLKEIDAEREELLRVAAALGINAEGSSATKRATRTTRRTSSPVRRRRSGRREQVLEAIGKKPGTTVTEIAKQLGVEPTSLYRHVRRLVADKAIRKDGTSLHPIAGKASR